MVTEVDGVGAVLDVAVIAPKDKNISSDRITKCTALPKDKPLRVTANPRAPLATNMPISRVACQAFPRLRVCSLP